MTFGRKPRLKTSGQVLAELDALRRQGVHGTFIVDDNLIGNKRAIRPLLRDLIGWQERNGYPMTFFTEASLDLAEEPELMSLMVNANIVNVFVGIESPNDSSLRETKKFQNVRPVGTLAERVRRIQEAGMEVMGGMILGFDHDDETVFDAQINFISEARIINVMLGMLSAIPKTPLYDRMSQEGRLDLANEATFGTNLVPLRLGREQLREGFDARAQRAERSRGLFQPARSALSRCPTQLQPGCESVLEAPSVVRNAVKGIDPGPGLHLPGPLDVESRRSRASS